MALVASRKAVIGLTTLAGLFALWFVLTTATGMVTSARFPPPQNSGCPSSRSMAAAMLERDWWPMPCTASNWWPWVLRWPS